MKRCFFFLPNKQGRRNIFQSEVETDYKNLTKGGRLWVVEIKKIMLHFWGKKFGRLKPLRFPGCAVPVKFVPSLVFSLWLVLIKKKHDIFFRHFSKLASFSYF